MINFTKTLNTKYTKQEQENARKMTIVRKYKELMAKAHEAKSLYIELKAKDI